MFWRTTVYSDLIINWKKFVFVENHWQYFLDLRKQKEVIGCQVRAERRLTHQFDVLSDQKGADLSRCARTRIAIVNIDTSFLVRFSNFPKEIVVYVAYVEQSLHDQFCRRNRRPFASKCFFHEQLSLNLACLRRSTWWDVVLFRAHTHRSMICLLWRSYNRL